MLEEMEAEGHEKNEQTHTLMVRASLARRDTQGAVEALAAMRKAGWAPGMKLYDLVGTPAVNLFFAESMHCTTLSKTVGQSWACFSGIQHHKSA